jgi:hypothetical protein
LASWRTSHVSAFHERNCHGSMSQPQYRRSKASFNRPTVTSWCWQGLICVASPPFDPHSNTLQTCILRAHHSCLSFPCAVKGIAEKDSFFKKLPAMIPAITENCAQHASQAQPMLPQPLSSHQHHHSIVLQCDHSAEQALSLEPVSVPVLLNKPTHPPAPAIAHAHPSFLLCSKGQC